MYINKVVFGNLFDFEEGEIGYLRDYGIIADTDYGTQEILAQTIQNLENDFDLEDVKEILEILNNRLGSDVVEGLQKNEIDFVLCIYD